VYNNNIMWGDVLLTNGDGSGCFSNGSNATYFSGDKVEVGECPIVNLGTISIGAPGVVSKTTFSGDYVQKAGGTLNIDADLQGGQANTLTVTGKANIAGAVNVNPISVTNKAVTVLTASGGVSVDPGLRQTDTSALFDFPVKASGNQLTIQPVAHFNDAATGLDTGRKQMASYLQGLFDGGAPMDFTALSKISAGDDFAASLRSMSGGGLGSFGAFRINSSRAFANNLYQGLLRRWAPIFAVGLVWPPRRVSLYSGTLPPSVARRRIGGPPLIGRKRTGPRLNFR
jgi:hypothetical protein